jgi:hypothetical protein
LVIEWEQAVGSYGEHGRSEESANLTGRLDDNIRGWAGAGIQNNEATRHRPD